MSLLATALNFNNNTAFLVLRVIVLLTGGIAVVGYSASGAYFKVSVHSGTVGANSHCHFLLVELCNVTALGGRRMAEP